MIVNQFGIGLSSNGVAFLSLGSGNPDIKSPAEPLPREDENSTTPWARWGDDNLLPQTMLKDIEGCGVLASAIDGKARFGLGRGPRPFILNAMKPDGSEDLTPVVDSEIEDFLEENDIFHSCFGWFKDQIGFANYMARFKFNNGGDKIGLVFRDDVTQMRYQKAVDGVIKKVYVSTFWDRNLAGINNDKTMLELDLLPSIGPATYLQNIDPQNRRAKEFAMCGRTPSWNRNYYSLPTWWAAKKWVDIAKGVPDMKAAMFQNNIRLKYIVTIYDSFWARQFGVQEWNGYTEQERQTKREEMYTSIDNWLVGSNNAYKSAYVPGSYDPVSGKTFSDIEIKPIEDSTKAGELLPDSAAANSEVLFALMMNPALMGADMPGGPYSGGAGSGSNIREAALVQVMIQEFERQQISRILNIVKKVNNWDPRIVWRFPGLVLTTLDTGKSTKEVTTG